MNKKFKKDSGWTKSAHFYCKIGDGHMKSEVKKEKNWLEELFSDISALRRSRHTHAHKHMHTYTNT
jgi:hypothetical protein